MITRDEILKLKIRYKDELYAKTRKEQKEDQLYIDDTFPVPEIRKPHRIYRSGIGRDMVDAPAEQIVTSNPQVFIDVVKGKQDAKLRLASLFNNWIALLRKQNPNPLKESVKNPLSRGENFIRISHNESWVTGKKVRSGLPILFSVPDPMVIYASPEEDDNGSPEKVLVFYERQPSELIVKYRDWTNPKGAGGSLPTSPKLSEWFEYWDKDVRYFEADGEPVLKGTDGVNENIYGFVPFVRKFSGFGKRSPSGELADLIVSDIRFARDLILEECITRSNIASIEFLFAHRGKTIISPGVLKEDDFADINWAAYGVKLFSNVPVGTTITDDLIHEPTAEMYQHLFSIRAELRERCPFLMAGSPGWASGRDQDLGYAASKKRYDTLIENTGTSWATAFEMVPKICKAVPTLEPKGLNKGDLDVEFRCEVKLKASDPIEEDRLSTLGDRLWAKGQGSIDLRTNLVHYQGYTEGEAEDIITDIQVDKATIFNPLWAEAMGITVAEELGMMDVIKKAKQKRLEVEQSPPMPPTTEERVKGEVETPLGREQGTVGSRGARRPPERYTRGQ